MQVLNQFNRN